jgi:hypothetical protein
MKMCVAATLGMLGLFGCGGAVAVNPAAKPATTAPLPPSAVKPAPSAQLTVKSFEAERRREATEPLNTYPITLAEGVEISVQSISPPVREVVVNAAGNNVVKLHGKLATDVDILYMYNPVVIDFGGMMATSSTRLAATNLKPMSSTFSLEFENGRPVPTWEILYKQASATGVMRETTFHLGVGTVFCIFDDPGFSRTYSAVVRSLASSARTTAVEPTALYTALSLVKFNGVAVGYQHFRVSKLAAGGFYSAAYSSVFIQGEAAVGLDSLETNVADAAGALLELSDTRAESSVVSLRHTLRRRGLGQYEYESTQKGIVDRGTLSGTLTSDVGKAHELRGWLAGAKAKPVVTDLVEKPLRIAVRKLTKESEGVALFEAADGKVSRCELNAEGTCARLSFPASSIELTQIASFGEMPRLGVPRK